MITAKQKAIQDAYGDHYSEASPHIKVDGWCEVLSCPWFSLGISAADRELDPLGNYWRPISLTGLRENNGWTRCDEAMPGKEVKQIHYCIEGKYGGKMPASDLAYSIHKMGIETFTHWKPYLPEPNPVY